MGYTARKDEIVQCAATWVELKGIKLSKLSQREKYQMISLICKFIEIQNNVIVTNFVLLLQKLRLSSSGRNGKIRKRQIWTGVIVQHVEHLNCT